MLAKEFFTLISNGEKTGTLKFKSGFEAYLEKSDISFGGNLATKSYYVVRIATGLQTVPKNITLHINEEWDTIEIYPSDGSMGEINEWRVESCWFDDIRTVIEQISKGEKSGYLYNSQGDKFRADKSTVSLSPYWESTSMFILTDLKTKIQMHYTAPKAYSFARHGQLADLNIIDFIEDSKTK